MFASCLGASAPRGGALPFPEPHFPPLFPAHTLPHSLLMSLLAKAAGMEDAGERHSSKAHAPAVLRAGLEKYGAVSPPQLLRGVAHTIPAPSRNSHPTQCVHGGQGAGWTTHRKRRDFIPHHSHVIGPEVIAHELNQVEAPITLHSSNWERGAGFLERGTNFQPGAANQ